MEGTLETCFSAENFFKYVIHCFTEVSKFYFFRKGSHIYINLCIRVLSAKYLNISIASVKIRNKIRMFFYLLNSVQCLTCSMRDIILFLF